MPKYLEKFFDNLNCPKNYLVGANFLLVALLIWLSNASVLPIQKVQDFFFFAVIALVFALYRPGWAFLFFVGTIALENINLAPDAFGLAIRPYQFIGALTLLAVIIRLLLKRANFELPKWKLVDWGVLVFAGAGLASAIFALNRGVSLKQSLIIFTFAGLYFLTRIFVQNLEDLKRIVPFFLSSGIAVIFYGIWQNVRFAKGLNSFEVMAGRPNSTFTEADWLGIYLVLVIAAIYAIIYYFHSAPIQSTRYKILNTFLYIILSTTYILLILTVSRSAWLGALAVTFVFLLAIFTQLKLSPKNWFWKKTFQIKMGILISFVIAIGAVSFFQLTTFQLWNRAGSTASGLQKITVSCASDIVLPEKINSVQDLDKYNCRHINLEEINSEKIAGNFVKEIDRPDPNVNIRAQIYQKSWKTIKENPILGIGWGNSGLVLGKDERGASFNSSNLFLEAWLGSGILGLLAVVFIWCYTIYRGGKSFLKSEGENKALGLFVLLGSIAILVPNLFNAGIFLGFLWVFWGVSSIRK
jgi:hypothetical protein